MKENLLTSGTPAEVREYMLGKYADWKKWQLSSRRTSKAAQYYVTASPTNQRIIKSLYGDFFHEPWPAKEVAEAEQKSKTTPKISRDDKIEDLVQQKTKLKQAASQIGIWERSQDWQEGTDFYERLKTLVEPLLKGTFSQTSYQAEHEVRRVSEVNGSQVDGTLDFMLGIQQNSEIVFTFDGSYVNGVTKLEQDFKAGLWGKLEATKSATRTDVAARVAVAVALGAKFSAKATTTWGMDGPAMQLAGEVKGFVGAQASAKAGFAAGLSGVEAYVHAGAFAGAKFSASGTCALLYEGEEVASVQGSVGITFGAGASFDMGIAASLFGPTQITLGGNLTVGLGIDFDKQLSINFNQAYLAADDAFKKAIYVKTIAQGWNTSLQKQDHKNKHYLKKSIVCLNDAIKEIDDRIKSMNSRPVEERSLLVSR